MLRPSLSTLFSVSKINQRQAKASSPLILQHTPTFTILCDLLLMANKHIYIFPYTCFIIET